MAIERQLQETIARCVSTVVYYQNVTRSREASERMAAEIQVIAGFVAELGLPDGKVEEAITRPVEAELTVRYGPEVGPRLADEFIDAFESIKAIRDQQSAGSPPPARRAPKGDPRAAGDRLPGGIQTIRLDPASE